MIVTNWTMRRFRITSFFVLLCARPLAGLPLLVPQSPEPSSRPETADESTEATTEPAALREYGEEGQYFQGDIKLLPDDDPYDLYRTIFKRMAFDREGSGNMELNTTSLYSRLWPGGYIPYIYAPHLSMEYRYVFEDAMNEWESATCIDFVRISDFNITEEDYLVLTDSSGCSSYVGRIGGPQEVSIGAGCLSKGHAMHEFGHALGLWHEHSRWDRDTYIRIVRQNIKDNAYYNFGTLSQEKWAHIDDVEYDLLSIMHYAAKSFSRNGADTIEVVVTLDMPECAINGMGQRKYLTKKDRLRTSRTYGCENDTQRAQRMQDNCYVDTVPSPSPTTSPLPPPPPPPPPVTNRLLSNDRLRLNTNSSQNESLFCTAGRCRKKQCYYNPYSLQLVCGEGFDFTIHLSTERKNKKIKKNDIVNLQSLHRTSRWLECSMQNICSISECPINSGSANNSNISECEDQRFKINTARTLLKDGTAFSLKHESNETFLYCNYKWCDLLPLCLNGEVGSNSDNRNEVLCHEPTVFYVEKL